MLYMTYQTQRLAHPRREDLGWADESTPSHANTRGHPTRAALSSIAGTYCNGTLVGLPLAIDNDAALLRIVEALLFAASEPLDLDTLRARLPEDTDVRGLINALQSKYADAGVNLVEVGGRRDLLRLILHKLAGRALWLLIDRFEQDLKSFDEESLAREKQLLEEYGEPDRTPEGCAAHAQPSPSLAPSPAVPSAAPSPTPRWCFRRRHR